MTAASKSGRARRRKRDPENLKLDSQTWIHLSAKSTDWCGHIKSPQSINAPESDSMLEKKKPVLLQQQRDAAWGLGGAAS